MSGISGNYFFSDSTFSTFPKQPFVFSLTTGFYLLTTVFSLLLSRQDHIEYQKSRPDTDRHIRHVKGRVMPGAELHVDKINDITKAQPVGHVPDYSRQQKGERPQDPVVGPRGPPKEIQHEGGCEESHR
jgi:hypothetical protein